MSILLSTFFPSALYQLSRYKYATTIIQEKGHFSRIVKKNNAIHSYKEAYLRDYLTMSVNFSFQYVKKKVIFLLL